MKLYATVTSERASKGQGGNEFIRTVLQYGGKDSKLGYLIRMDGEVLKLYHNGQHEVTIHHGQQKGEKQKGTPCCEWSEQNKYAKGEKQKHEKHVHDWDNYGKCTICGKWDTDGTRLQ